MTWRRLTLFRHAAAAALIVIVAACGSNPEKRSTATGGDTRGSDVVVFALGLLDTDYRFGGKNPEAGFDCSGMVNYVYAKAAGFTLGASAAEIARKGRRISLEELRPGDLVFFNTNGRPFSHVGIFIGDGRFVHAPSTNTGKVRTDSLRKGWFAKRFEEARTYFD